MKSNLKTTCIILLLSYQGYSQDLGFKAQIGASKYNFRQVNFPTYVSQFETFQHSPIWSASIGGYTKFNTFEKVSFSAGLNYTKKGNREFKIYKSIDQGSTNTTYLTTEDNKIDMHYFDLTGFVHFNTLNIFIGGQVSYLSRIDYVSYYNITKSADDIELFSDTQESKSKYDFMFDYYNRFEISAMIGYEYDLNDKAKLTFTYLQGITGVLNQDFFINYRNSQLMLGLSYSLKKKQFSSDQ